LKTNDSDPTAPLTLGITHDSDPQLPHNRNTPHRPIAYRI
jgi:hypothetical protein